MSLPSVMGDRMRGLVASVWSLVALASLATLAAAGGCGGQIIMGASDGGAEPVTSVTGSGSSGEDASTDGAPSTGSTGTSPGGFPECPGQQPKAGYTCTTPNQGCVYKDLTAKTCVSWTCTSGHVWVNSTPAGC
jgi:hypothetical protein